MKLAMRYLFRRKTRSILTMMAIVFGVMIMFGMNGMIPAIQDVFAQNVQNAAHGIDLLIYSENNDLMDDQWVTTIANKEGIAKITGVLEYDWVLEGPDVWQDQDGQVVDQFIINGYQAPSAQGVIPLTPDQGRWLQVGDQGKAMVRSTFTERFGLGLGDHFTLGESDFEIVGVFPRKPTLGHEEIYLPMADAQTLYGQGPVINALVAAFDASVTDGQALRQAILTEINQETGAGFAVGAVDAGANEWASLIEMGNVMFTGFGLVALVMGGFIMYNTFKISIAERRKDMGMLRTLGATRKTVIRVVLAEGLLLGIAGTALGMVFGYGMVVAMMAAIRPLWLDMFQTELGAPHFTPMTWVTSIAFGLLIPVLSVYFPAKKATEIQPLEALRPDNTKVATPYSSKRKIAALVLVPLGLALLIVNQPMVNMVGGLLVTGGLLMGSPFLLPILLNGLQGLINRIFGQEGLLATRNIRRHTKRAVSTTAAMMISVALLVAVAGLASSFTIGMMGYLDKSMRSDYLLLPASLVLGSTQNEGVDSTFDDRLSAISGVGEFTALRNGSGSVEGIATDFIGIDPASYEKLSGLTFMEGNEATAYRQMEGDRQVIINGALALQAGAGVGDQVELQTPTGDHTYEVVAVGLDYLNSKLPTAYVNQRDLDQDFGSQTNIMYMINRSQGADPKQVEQALLTLANDSGVFSVMSYEVWRDFQLEGNHTRSMFMYVLVLILAVPSLIALANTLAMNIIERTREIGLLRAIGTTGKQVNRMIIAESLLLSFMGTLLGIVGGLALGYGFVQMMNVTGFLLPYTFPLLGLVIALVLGVTFGVVAALTPIRRVANLNVIEAIAYE